MKNIFTISSIITFLLLFSACTKAPSELIIGKWNIVDVKTTIEMTDEQKDSFKQTLEEIKAGSFLQINEDKTFNRDYMGETSTGKWKISEDGKKLTLTYGSTNEVSKINELTDKSLSLTILVNAGENTIIYAKIK